MDRTTPKQYWPYRWKLTLIPANIGRNILTITRSKKTHTICPNRSAVRECKGWVHGVRIYQFQQWSLSSDTYNTHIHGKQQLHGPFFTRISGDSGMCGSQTDRNIARILVLLDDLLMFYQAFGVNLMMWCVFCCRVVRVY